MIASKESPNWLFTYQVNKIAEPAEFGNAGKAVGLILSFESARRTF